MKLAYRINEHPKRPLEAVLYGWQHTLVDVSPFIVPLAIAKALGLDDAGGAQLINYCLLSMGVATLLQTTIGNRLPIIQGPSTTLIGAMVPVAQQLGGGAMWGAAALGGAIEGLVGGLRLLRYLRRLFTPLVSGTVITVIGLALGQVAVRLAINSGHPVDLMLATGVILAVLTLQLLCTRLLSGILARGAIFFSLWAIGLGVGAALGRVDGALIAAKPWFSAPALLPFGGPFHGWSFPLAACFAVFVGYLGSMVESVGDYAATCAAADEPFIANHIDRGIFAEGLGSLIATLLGGLPCTSYTQNIGIIATTRVASRVVVQIAALILLLYGLSPKVGALLVAMPRSVVGGVFVIVCGMIVAAGLELLSQEPATPERAMVSGPSLIVAVGLPAYLASPRGAALLERAPLSARLMLSNAVVLAVVCSLVLQALVGLLKRRQRSA